MSNNLRIFISSTCNDLFQERRDLVRAFLGLGHSVVVSDRGDSLPVDPRLSAVASCLDAIRHNADFIVLVISNRYAPYDGGKSVTELEYLEAVATGLPVLSFVRDTVWAQLPLFKKNPNIDLTPIVPDNRVFEFIENISNRPDGNWLFPFREADEIVDIVKYQISAHFRKLLGETNLSRSGRLVYNYTNNSNILLSADGTARRHLEYEIYNGTTEAVSSLECGDRSDIDLSWEDLGLVVSDETNNDLRYEVIKDTARHKRWRILPPKPIPPGESFRYSCAWISCDLGEMETRHFHPGFRGYIQCLFAPGTINQITSVQVRDHGQWRLAQASIIETAKATAVGYHYRETTGEWQFRVRWN